MTLACAVLASVGHPARVKPSSPVKVDGCALLADPAKYNQKIVRVDGLVHTDFEHFDLRLECDGFISLETSSAPQTIAKYGFRTTEDEQFKHLMSYLKKGQTSGSSGEARAGVTGLFRCHYDFPDCSGLSVYGDSSIVIRSVSDVRAD